MHGLMVFPYQVYDAKGAFAKHLDAMDVILLSRSKQRLHARQLQVLSSEQAVQAIGRHANA